MQPSTNGVKPIIEIVPVCTAEQLGDMPTKPLPAPAFHQTPQDIVRMVNRASISSMRGSV